MGTKQQHNKHLGNIFLGIIGSPDFCRRLRAVALASDAQIRTCSGGLLEAWSLILTNKPNVLIVEIGFQHSERLHALLRDLLAQLRERFGDSILVAVALTAPDKFFFGGDLLFLSEETLDTSNFVDTFVAIPPGNMPSIPGLAEQFLNVISLYSDELSRREQGAIPLPPLGASGWVQSLADPLSRELWMKWLPRYASYTNENPIITGKTGTGKTNIAYALHLLSGRTGEFISMTPRDFSSSELVQVELFGAVAGAYTGAVDKWGLVKAAEKGTLFIDELQSIDKDLQGKLITFIENKVYRRVGSAETIEADVRFIFASNRSLYDMMESDTLRDDFAYRLERLQLELRPLAARRLDIAAALAYALAKVHRQRPLRNKIDGINADGYRILFGHCWPGNLRQLENNVAQLCEVADMSGLSTIDEHTVRETFESHLSGSITTTPDIFSHAAHTLFRFTNVEPINSVDEGISKFIEFVRLSALEAAGGDIDKASEMVHDNPKLLDMVAKAIVAKKEVELIK
ncbi:sigma 54-interacting transcriptional regulator [Oligoflexia bacterium]|nr:sigma 54-interacting transcriptional regulator [Oligoflexia bacterium]